MTSKWNDYLYKILKFLKSLLHGKKLVAGLEVHRKPWWEILVGTCGELPQMKHPSFLFILQMHTSVVYYISNQPTPSFYNNNWPIPWLL